MTMKETKCKCQQKAESKHQLCSLPSPDKLVDKEFTLKVTLLLNKSTVDYFKNAAEKHGVCYQAMIRNLLDEYVKHYEKF